jgi:hypothetical protein
MTIIQLSPRDQDFEDLFDAITSTICRTYDDIGAVTTWGNNKVALVLSMIRRPEIAAEQGWTVPHVPRGPGDDHLYQVVFANGGNNLDPEEQAAVKAGAVSTLRTVATQSENEAHALREASRYVGPTAARRLRRVALAQEGVAAMARDATESLNGTAV